MLTYAVSADPSLAPTLEVLRNQIDRGQHATVLPQLQELSVVAPELAEVWELLTLAHLAAGHRARAQIAAAQLRVLDPGPTAYLLGSQALIGHNNAKALAEAESARASAPGIWVTHSQVARCYAVTGNADRQGRDLRAAHQGVALAPTSAGARAVLARVQLNHGDLEAAEESARAAMDLNSREPEAQRVLADVIAERSLRTTRANVRRAARAQVATRMQRMLNRLVGLELFSVALAVLLVTSQGMSGGTTLGLALAAGLLLVSLVGYLGQAGARQADCWYCLVPNGFQGAMTAVGFLGSSLTLAACLGVAAGSSDLRGISLQAGFVAMVIAMLTGLSAAARCRDLAEGGQFAG